MTAVASGFAVAYSDRSPCPSHGGSRRGLHQARRGGPQECGARGVGAASAIWWPPGTGHTRCRSGPAPAPRRGPPGFKDDVRGGLRRYGAKPGIRHLNPWRGLLRHLEVSDRAHRHDWMDRPGHRPGDSEAGRGVHDPQSPQTRAAGGWAPCPDSSYQRGARSGHRAQGDPVVQGAEGNSSAHPSTYGFGYLSSRHSPRSADANVFFDSPRTWRSGRAPPPRLVGTTPPTPGCSAAVRFPRPPPSRPPTRPT